MSSSIGFVGLGAMGRPMARHLSASGFAVTGFDPYAAIDPSDGIERVNSAKQLASASEVICLMVATPQQALDTMSGSHGLLAGLRAGTVVIVMATVGPTAISELESLVRAAGGSVLDAPVSGGVGRATTGELLIMASGSARDFATSRPALDTLGGTIHFLGSTAGDAQRMKLVNQLLCGVHIAAAAEALAFAQSLDIDPAVALKVVGSGAAASFMLDDRGPRMLERAFTEPRSAVDIFVKDLSLVEDAASFPIPIAHAAAEQFRAVSAAGGGRLDDSALITSYPTTTKERP